MENQVETIKYTPEKAKQNALAKLDLIRKWQEFRRKAVNKLQTMILSNCITVQILTFSVFWVKSHEEACIAGKQA